MDNPINFEELKPAKEVDSPNTSKFAGPDSSVRRKCESKFKNTQNNLQKTPKDPNLVFKKQKKKPKNKSFQSEAPADDIDTPKFNRNIRKPFTSEVSDPRDITAKMNSIGNMRKLPKKNEDTPSSSAMGVKDPIEDARPRTDICFNLSYSQNTNMSPGQRAKPRTPISTRAGVKPSPAKPTPPKKNLKFQPYIPLFEVQQGLKRGEFIEGALRINPRCYEDAYLNSPDGKMDIYIGGMQDRNRALNGDIVVVQVNPKQEWKILCDAIKDYQERSGENFVKAICNPVGSPVPCKVHTPDKFVQPESSNEWNGLGEHRKPDTLEILGVDELVTNFEDLSVKPKQSKSETPSIDKQKNRKKRSKKKAGSQGSVASSSHDSLDDSHETCPRQNVNLHTHDANATCESLKQNDLPKSAGEINFQSSNCSETNQHCDSKFNVIENKKFDSECLENKFNKDTGNNWNQSDANNVSSVNLIISPEQLFNFEDHRLQLSEQFAELANISKDCDSDNNSDLDNKGIIVVPPDALTGEEFTDSASVTSTHSHCYDQIVEDNSFYVAQQDSENNNTSVIDFQEEENRNIAPIEYNEDSSGLVTISSTLQRFVQTKEYDCKIQNNIIPLKTVEIATESDVCSTLITRADSKEIHSSSDENVILLPINECNVAPVIGNEVIVQENLNIRNSKNSRSRKRRKKRSNQNKQSDAEVKFQPKVSDINPLEIDKLIIDDVMKHPLWPKFVQKTGKIVHILERKHSCLAAGHIKLYSDKNIKWALFSPNDSRIPRIMVPMTDCPLDFYNRPQDYKGVLFLAEIKSWNETSTFAAGRLVKSLGNTGDIECETNGILLENAVDYGDFPLDVLNCLPDSDTWSIPKAELNARRDFRLNCVFTIDPSTARDMDDAVSCTALENGNFEVGVHIADVTYFVKEKTALDAIAEKRATSVYLVQKVVPMLPRLLCDNLCSLNPGTDRLSFSVVWEISPIGEVMNEWFGRTVINSCMKMSYEHAQDMIENPNRVWTANEHPGIHGNFTISEIICQVNQLNSLAVVLRENRFRDGALRLDQAKLQFTLNPETGLPSGFNVFEQKDSNRLIEEFMLLANMSVARKIYQSFPHLSLLRRHPPPQHLMMEEVVATCAAVGIHLDISSSGSLQSSIAYYSGNDFLSKSRTLLLTNLCSKPMNCALYFCTGALEDPTLFHHYALNVPFYTHFTSPIRRYPDIITHRLLDAALKRSSFLGMDSTQMERCAVHCNDKKYSAKRVSELSGELFLAAFIRECGSVNSKAIVTNVMDHSFDCLVLDMGIIKRVYCDKLPLFEKKFQKNNGAAMLTLMWYDASEQNVIPQALTMFSLVDVTLTVDKELLKICVSLNSPFMQNFH